MKYSNNYEVVLRYLRVKLQKSVSYDYSIASMITSIFYEFPVDSYLDKEDGGHAFDKSVIVVIKISFSATLTDSCGSTP